MTLTVDEVLTMITEKVTEISTTHIPGATQAEEHAARMALLNIHNDIALARILANTDWFEVIERSVDLHGNEDLKPTGYTFPTRKAAQDKADELNGTYGGGSTVFRAVLMEDS